MGLIAWVDGAPAGAAWIRLMAPDRPGYGWVDAATPELSVAVLAAHRDQGWGRALVTGVLDLAAAHGHPQVSLSVADAVNPVAARLYRDLGFTEVGRDSGGLLTMVATTAPPSPEPDAGPPVTRPATADDGPALARLREVMFTGGDLAGRPGSVVPFLAAWERGSSIGTWRARVVDGPQGRPVCSALGVVGEAPPAPGREAGRMAHISSVATEPTWRGHGCARAAVTALVGDLDDAGVERLTLNATAEGAGLYASLGFTPVPGAMQRRPPP